MKPCERHLYWSATTTSDGNGKIIWAKFKSFLSHIVNKHSNLDEPLFNKCAHGDIPDRKWLDPGTTLLPVIKFFNALWPEFHAAFCSFVIGNFPFSTCTLRHLRKVESGGLWLCRGGTGNFLGLGLGGWWGADMHII